MIYRSAAQTAPATASPTLPAWLTDFIAAKPGGWTETCVGDLRLRSVEENRFALTSVAVEGFLDLDQEACSARCAAAYDLLFQCLGTLDSPYPIRLWNFIPGILSPVGNLPHRYMAFNAGRYEAFRRCHGGELATCLPTATGVGRYGDDLFVHCLSAASPGTPVENPRQISSYRYSRKYGPLPPCFARATRIDSPATTGDDALLLVGGTASVRGEDSITEAGGAAGTDLQQQLRETFLNLASLIRSAAEGTPAPRADSTAVDDLETGLLLGRYRHLRTYVRKGADLRFVAEQIETRFVNLENAEYVHADLCRPELLVEIEGVASVPRRPRPDGSSSGAQPCPIPAESTTTS